MSLGNALSAKEGHFTISLSFIVLSSIVFVFGFQSVNTVLYIVCVMCMLSYIDYYYFVSLKQLSMCVFSLNVALAGLVQHNNNNKQTNKQQQLFVYPPFC